MTVAIVTDLGSDLTPAQLRDNQIKQVPLSVSFGEETYLSPDEMTPEVFWERLLAPDSPFPHTAAPSIGLFKRAFEEAFADGHEAVICICLSGDLSATFKHARLAGEMLPDRPITIVDSRLASIATGALALSAARLAELGHPSPRSSPAWPRFAKAWAFTSGWTRSNTCARAAASATPKPPSAVSYP